jgi:hypothetical protein
LALGKSGRRATWCAGRTSGDARRHFGGVNGGSVLAFSVASRWRRRRSGAAVAAIGMGDRVGYGGSRRRRAIAAALVSLRQNVSLRRGVGYIVHGRSRGGAGGGWRG